MKKEVKKEVKKEEKSSSSTKGPGGEHMFQVSTCIATDSLRLIRTRRGETRKKYISGSSCYVNNWINTVNVEKLCGGNLLINKQNVLVHCSCRLMQ